MIKKWKKKKKKKTNIQTTFLIDKVRQNEDKLFGGFLTIIQLILREIKYRKYSIVSWT